MTGPSGVIPNLLITPPWAKWRSSLMKQTWLDQPSFVPRILTSNPLKISRKMSSDIQKLEWMMHREGLDYRVADCRTNLVFINQGAPMQILLTDP